MMAARAIRVISLQERMTRLFPRGDLFDREGRSLMLPATRALKAVKLEDVAGGVQLRALGLVGHLPLTREITLNLTPKFPTNSLWYMLDTAGHTFQTILPVLRSYENTDEAAPHFLLARSFCFYLKAILRSGLDRRYEPHHYEGYFRAKVDFGRTIAKFVGRGDEISTSSRVFAFGPHTRLNGHLKAACIRFLGLLPVRPEWAEDRALLITALTAMNYTTEQVPRGDLISLAESAPARVREPYIGAMASYAVLLGQTRIGFSYDPGGTTMPSFLFSLDEVFEQFVRNVLRQGLRPNGIGVADGNLPRNQGKLFADSRRYAIKPDLIFRNHRVTIAAGEVKHKHKLEESDRYQLISHALALHVTCAVWISPAVAPGEAGLEYVGAVSNGIRFHHYRLDIGSNIRESCDHMCNAINGLLAPIGVP
jgi:5-methylcytosine-specific restriction enzyme subunit McrC